MSKPNKFEKLLRSASRQQRRQMAEYKDKTEQGSSAAKKPDDGQLPFVLGVIVALVPWGLTLIGVTVNVFLGGVILTVAFVLIVYAFWIWERPWRWRNSVRIGTIILFAFVYFFWAGKQMVAEWSIEHPEVSNSDQSSDEPEMITPENVGRHLETWLHQNPDVSFTKDDPPKFGRYFTIKVRLPGSPGILIVQSKDFPNTLQFYGGVTFDETAGRRFANLPDRQKMKIDDDIAVALEKDLGLKTEPPYTLRIEGSLPIRGEMTGDDVFLEMHRVSAGLDIANRIMREDMLQFTGKGVQ